MTWEWDVWPADTARPRIAMGNADSPEGARAAVESILGADDSALIGTVTSLYEAPAICRRGRQPGTYVWGPLDFSRPLSAAN